MPAAVHSTTRTWRTGAPDSSAGTVNSTSMRVGSASSRIRHGVQGMGASAPSRVKECSTRFFSSPTARSRLLLPLALAPHTPRTGSTPWRVPGQARRWVGASRRAVETKETSVSSRKERKFSTVKPTITVSSCPVLRLYPISAALWQK